MINRDLLSLASENIPENKRLHILVVDDEADIGTIIKKGLEIEDFEVDNEQDPRKALANFKPGSYDMLLIDVRMPSMNGFELYREIRKIDRKVRVCFIAAFEMYFDEFKRVFPKIHVSCFIHKPVTISQLARAVRDELARPPDQEDEQTPTATTTTQPHRRETSLRN
jgi:DNA-binding response OmpR family regulator